MSITEPSGLVRIVGEAPDARIVARAVALLRRGRIIVYPTDTLYAVGGAALDRDAIRLVIAAKQRPAGKPFPVVVSDAAQAKSLCGGWSCSAEALSRRFWPGALTLVLPAAADLPSEIMSQERKIAVRVPALGLARRLCMDAGALVATSANRSGEAPPTRCEDAYAAMAGFVTMALDSGPTIGAPSTIVDVSEDAPLLLREGRIAWNEVRAVLGSD